MTSLLLLLLSCSKGDGSDLPDPPSPEESAAPDADSSESGESGAQDSDASGSDSDQEALDCPEPPPLPELSEDEWTLALPAPGGDITHFGGADGRVYAASSVNGIYLSEDGGEQWTPLQLMVSHVYGQMAVNPDQLDQLAYTTGKVQVSQDGGQTWQQLDVGDTMQPEETISGLVWWDGELISVELDGEVKRIDPSTGQAAELGQVGDGDVSKGGTPPHGGAIAAGGAWALYRGGEALYALQDGRSLWRSLDQGESWEVIREASHHFYGLQAQGDELWLSSGQQLYHSPDQGETFSLLATAEEDLMGLSVSEEGAVLLVGEGQLWSYREGSLEVASAKGEPAPTAVWSSDQAPIWSYRDGVLYQSGDSWSEGEGLIDQDLSVLLAHPECAQLMWVGTQCQRGLFYSEDWGATLEHEPTTMHYVMRAITHPHRPDEFWVTTDDTVWRSVNRGADWEELPMGSQNYHFHAIGLDPFVEGQILIGSVGDGLYRDPQGAQVYRSEDNGQTWSQSSEGLPSTSTSSFHELHFVEGQEGVVLLGTFRAGDISHLDGSGVGLFRSTDHGESWSEVESPADNIAHIEQCGERVYAATDAGLLWSEDGGQSWTVGHDEAGEILALACHESTLITLSVEGALFRSDEQGIEGSWRDWGWSDVMEVTARGGQRLYDLAISADGQIAWLAFRDLGLYLRAL